MEPTVRRLRRGEAVAGQLVEYLGPARLDEEGGPLYEGHPGRVLLDWDDQPGGSVVVVWHGLEDSPESSSAVAYGYDEAGEYRGLGWIDQQVYDVRGTRLDHGEPPLGR